MSGRLLALRSRLATSSAFSALRSSTWKRTPTRASRNCIFRDARSFAKNKNPRCRPGANLQVELNSYPLAALSIGDVSLDVKSDVESCLVPSLSLSPSEFENWLLQSHEALDSLRWMMQKDSIGQDVVLLGPPGPFRRLLALRYCTLTGREYEYVSITRDTTEADLKQSRGITNKSALLSDQSAVRAAIHGRILILEGLEKAERNILPIINNLLENREMALEDGRFLTNPARYDKLLSEGYSKDELDKLGLIRVHNDFRVVALALPVPRYAGHPLDPPLRSRFQAKYVSGVTLQTQIEYIKSSGLSVIDQAQATKVVSFAELLRTFTTTTQENYRDLFKRALIEFPDSLVAVVLRSLALFPGFPAESLVRRLIPHELIDLKNVNQKDIENAFQLTGLRTGPRDDISSFEVSKETLTREMNGFNVHFKKASLATTTGQIFNIDLMAGDSPSLADNADIHPHIQFYEIHLASMLHDHALGRDVAIIAPKGTGKSSLAYRFASILGYQIETILLHKDMNYRDLLQRRATKSNGDTIWQNSRLVEAALHGRLAILDNIDRLGPGAISSIQSLLSERLVHLPDGSRLVSAMSYQELLSRSTKSELEASRIYPIHPAFRILALGDLPTQKHMYITTEVSCLFNFHQLKVLPEAELSILLSRAVPHSSHRIIHQLILFCDLLRKENSKELAAPSMRQLIRTLVQVGHDPNAEIASLLKHQMLYSFMPSHTKNRVDEILKQCGISQATTSMTRVSVPDSTTQAAKDSHLVPHVVYHRIKAHEDILSQMITNFKLGEHLLLIGSQGTGKNKLTDQMLQILRLPREYIQLHRDTTVATLTSQPTVKDHVIVWEDSALVKAVKYGRVLVIDECDKAEREVTSVLKNLVDGEMLLADGRRIVSKAKLPFFASTSRDNIIEIHPSFRMIVLANRPGWPFHGNDFFKELGDLFAVATIDNPDQESEFELLSFYGPDVKSELLQRIVGAFDELRRLHDEGVITYPYSTRESINIVKHLQKYPDDPLEDVLQNVFAFDQFDHQTRYHIQIIFKKNGMGDPFKLVPIEQKPRWQLVMDFENQKKAKGPKHGKEDPTNAPHVGGNTWAGGTGGSDTAGLGGKGGPYRLDKGHQIYQINDAEKLNVPEEVKQAARQMAKEALAARLKEIEMKAYDAEVYEQYSGAVVKQVDQLRVVLEGLQAVNKDDRKWIKNQTDGDLDENRLVEGIIGEKTVFKRRAVGKDDFPSNDFKTPKDIRFVMDVSGSMYRFNGNDGRLDRLLETAVLIMEAFEGFESRITYTMVGHSGEDVEISFVTPDRVPKNRKERMQVLQRMVAHSQFCMSGDHTLEAAELAMKRMAAEEADEKFVFVVSDANFDRYRISPTKMKGILESDPNVNANIIFISSLWHGQAERIIQGIGNKAHKCFSTTELPQLFMKLLATNVFR